MPPAPRTAGPPRSPDAALTTALLRPWRPADAADLLTAVRASPDLDRQLPPAALRDLDGCAEVAGALAAWGPRDHHLAVEVAGRVVGSVGIGSVEPHHGTAWLSYWLSTGVRGQGLATRALATAADLALGRLDLFRLELGHRTDNPASCRVAARAGFLPEGVERARLRYGDRRYDVETHARLRTDPPPDVHLLPVRGVPVRGVPAG
ncbi:GNAT family N-acetyltransferase [Cellulomonas sp. NPDC058312]|uniref:GNAT family N-acetyltransferase n=1 Tax=Cellulomonas sp. NPDC058312 TaxID=3346441 RepID=UPI0036EE0AE8